MLLPFAGKAVAAAEPLGGTRELSSVASEHTLPMGLNPVSELWRRMSGHCWAHRWANPKGRWAAVPPMAWFPSLPSHGKI